MGKTLLCPEDRRPCDCSGERGEGGILRCPRTAARVNRSRYEVVKVDTDRKIVWIVDLNVGKSVTNDAEKVCEELNRQYPLHRIIYRDSDKNWDELVHLDWTFNHYAAARGMAIQV